MEQKIAYMDCFAGISGDMFLGALIAAGLPLAVVETQLAKLDIKGYQIKVTPLKASAIAATRLTVHSAEQGSHRHFAKIKDLISRSNLAAAVQDRAIKIFTVLAEAEAAVHDCDINQVHFHEVGAVDAIVDIVGAAIGLEYLGLAKIYSSPLPMPHGWVKCAHGHLPLPAPAVLAILKDVPVYGIDIDQEMVTPTGAAIIKAMATDFGPMPVMRLQKTAYAAGHTDFGAGRPNLLRISLGVAHAATEAQEVEVIETNIDDMAPEIFPYLYEKLFALAALDVISIPGQMKKGRLGFLLKVICTPVNASAIKECILTETSAIGLRFRREQRLTLPRQTGVIKTQWGELQVKLAETPDGPRLQPEYEDCRRLAEKNKIALPEIYREAARFTPEDFQPCPLSPST